ncbi:MAG: transglycosylase family protein, partial [Acidimicrobiales bacterium]
SSPAAAHASSVPSGGLAACIIARENGGSYGRSSNPSHFGRYQFSRGTWAAYGGSPDTWGSASPAEQDAVFARALASPGGAANWTPFDHC